MDRLQNLGARRFRIKPFSVCVSLVLMESSGECGIFRVETPRHFDSLEIRPSEAAMTRAYRG